MITCTLYLNVSELTEMYFESCCLKWCMSKLVQISAIYVTNLLYCWSTFRVRYAMLANVGPSVIHLLFVS